MRVAVHGNERAPILDKILKRAPQLSLIAYVGALYWAWIIFNPEACEHTRVSEHALMGGVVHEKFDREDVYTETLHGLQKYSDQREFLIGQLKNYGIVAYEQGWKTTTGLVNASGVNVWGVVRASRAASTESILLIVDIADDYASSLLVALVAYFRAQPYWARDIFILLSEGQTLGVEAFLSAFHDTSSDVIQFEDLQERGDSVLAVLAFKTNHGVKSNDLELHINQLNGALPNLDYVNTIIRISGLGRFRMPALLYNIRDSHEGGTMPWWLIPARALYTQAFVSMEGLHSLSSKYGTQGVLLELPLNGQSVMRKSAKLVEAVVRSLNNMLERFHQSYFLYILADEDNFVSIAYFMPILGGILAPLLIIAYREWVYSVKVLEIPSFLGFVHGMGLLTWAVSTNYFKSSSHVDNNAMNLWLVLLVILSIPLTLFWRIPQSSFASLRFILLLEAAMLLGLIGLLNFSLALMVAIPATPMLIIFSHPQTQRSRFSQYVISTMSFLAHPFVLYIFWKGYVSSFLMLGEFDTTSLGLNDVVEPLQKLLLSHILYGCNLYPLLTILAVPIWNILFGLALPVSVSKI